jgi:serine/threonine protein kinase
MSDELQLGKLLVKAGKITQQDLGDLLAEQKKRRQGGETSLRLGELMLLRGLVTAKDIRGVLARQTKVITICIGCGMRYNVAAFDPDKRYRCKKCKADLVQEDEGDSVTVNETKTVPSVRVGTPVDLEKAKADPKNRMGKFILIDELGRGGMGVVHRAWQEDLQRIVALKILTITDDEFKKRFLLEARINSKLKHANIVSVHELGEENNRAFFTMDFVEGATLDSLIKPKRPPIKYMLDLLRKVAEALHSAHQQGVIHRDIKPGNILLGEDGEPFLSDFGLARDISADLNLTNSGDIIGTPRYMSPEQARGKQRLVDARSDVFSMGVVLYEGVTGKTPFLGQTILSLLNNIVKQVPVRPSRVAHGIPKDVDTIVMKCLEKDPRRRYQTALDLARDINRYLSGKPIVARPVGGVQQAARWMKARPLWVGAVVAAIPILILVFLLVSRDSSSEDRIRELELQLAEGTSEEKETAREELAGMGRLPDPQKEPVKEPEKETGKGPKKDPDKPPPVRTRWYEVQTVINRHVGNREFQAAREKLAAFKPETPEERNLATDSGEGIERAALMAWEEMEEKIDALMENAQFEDAKRLAGPPMTWGSQDVRDLVKEKVREIDEAVAEKVKKAMVSRLPVIRREVLSLCQAGKYAEAREKLASLKNLPLGNLGWIVEETAKVPGSLKKGAEALKGENITIPKTGECEILGGDDRKLWILVIRYKAEIKRTYTGLEDALLTKLAKAGGASPAGLGLFHLFAGDVARARASWAESPRKDELEKLASEVERGRIEAEGAAALKELFAAADRKDWKAVRAILAKRDRYAFLPEWDRASDRINEIALTAGGDVKPLRGLFAVEPKARGKTLTWDYVFDNENSLGDWRVFPFDYTNTKYGLGLELKEGRLRIKSAEARFFAKLEGNQAISAEITYDREGVKEEGHINLLLGGYRWEVVSGLKSRLFLPDGTRLSDTTAPPDFLPGMTARAEMVLTKGKLSCSVNGSPVFQIPVIGAPAPNHPGISCWRDTLIHVSSLQLQGTISGPWKREYLRRKGEFAKVGKEYRLDDPIEISDGTSMDQFILAETGRWEMNEEGIKAVPDISSRKCQLDYDDRKYRAYRFRMKYKVHRGTNFKLRVRGGDYSWTFVIPTDKKEVWRDMEIVSLPEGSYGIIDGKYHLALEGQILELKPFKMLRIYLQEWCTITIKDAYLWPIRNVPDDGPPSCLFYMDQVKPQRFTVAGKWLQIARGLRGTGTLTSKDRYSDFDLIFRARIETETKLTVSVRGQLVFGELFEKNADGKMRTYFIRCRGNTADFLGGGKKLTLSENVNKGGFPFVIKVEGKQAQVEHVFIRKLR